MSSGRLYSFDHYLLARIMEACGRPPITLAIANGASVSAPGACGALVFRDRRTLAGLLLDPEIGFGDAYCEGRIEIHGDLVSVLDRIYEAWPRRRSVGWLSGLISTWFDWVQAPSLRGARKNIHHHYDLGNDFYRLWLDRDLVYTCAYFPRPEATLEEAQIAKMDHVCRKLQLQPGETVVEAGCGWGSFALHMARQYGVLVRAFNISPEQIRYARERAAEEGLGDRVQFIEDDYRNITGHYDVFVSVGMLEHVGTENYSVLGRVIHQSIGDRGRGLLHFIGRNSTRPLSRWIRKRIFPGAHPPTLSETAPIFEPWDYSVLDVENLRLHYAKTLEHWLERFERQRDRVPKHLDEHFLRAWRLYLAGSMSAFRTGWLQLFQVLFAGRECDRIPWTRDYQYSGGRGQEFRRAWTATTS